MPRWSIDPGTSALLAELTRTRPRPFGVMRPRRDPALFHSIGARGQPGAVVSLLPYTLTRDLVEATAAAGAVQCLIQPLIPRHVVALDEWLRHGAWYRDRTWPDLRPSALTRLLRLPQDLAHLLLAIACCHHNGHVREAAIEHLAAADADVAVPFLLVRVNDWVPEVRAAADGALEKYLDPAKAGRVVACLPLLERLAPGTRASHGRLISRVESALASREARAAVLAGTRSREVQIRRYAYRLLLRVPGEDPTCVLQAAVTEPDPPLALWALRTASATLAPAPLDALLQRALTARSARVRVEALRLVTEHSLARAVECHRALLADRAASVRAQAQWLVRRETGDDLRFYYRELVAARDSASLAAGLSGLGETGLGADAELIEPHTNHHAAGVRAAAVTALHRLCPMDCISLFTLALQDRSAKVSRVAAGALRRVRHLPSASELWSIFTSASMQHVQRNAIALLARRARWDSIVFLLQAAGCPDPVVERSVRQQLRRWLARTNRDFTEPSAAALTHIRQVFAERSAHVDPVARDQLAFILRTTAG